LVNLEVLSVYAANLRRRNQRTQAIAVSSAPGNRRRLKRHAPVTMPRDSQPQRPRCARLELARKAFQIEMSAADASPNTHFSQPQRAQPHPNSVPESSKAAESLPVTSSMPMDIPEQQATLFREVLLLLEGKKFPYAVSGAFALRQHTGICRFTKDLDLFMTASTSHQLLPYLRQHGFECEVCDPVWLAKVHKGEFFVDLITGMSNAVIVVEDSWIERAHPAMVHGVKTRVLAPEELVASKVFVAKRERFDGADIAHIIYGTYPNFDWDRELQLVGEHWEMLLWSLLLFRYVYPAQTHYVPPRIWHELLQRLEDQIAKPDPHPTFRGSLVDENMFAIDLNEWGLANLLEDRRQRRLSELERANGRPNLLRMPKDAPRNRRSA